MLSSFPAKELSLSSPNASPRMTVLRESGEKLKLGSRTSIGGSMRELIPNKKFNVSRNTISASNVFDLNPPSNSSSAPLNASNSSNPEDNSGGNESNSGNNNVDDESNLNSSPQKNPSLGISESHRGSKSEPLERKRPGSISVKRGTSFFRKVETKNADVMEKMKKDSSLSILPEDQLKILSKQLCDPEEFHKRFFSKEELEEYNKTHGDGLKVSSLDHWKNLHAQIFRNKHEVAVPSLRDISDVELWSRIEKDAKNNFWSLMEVKLLLTTGLPKSFKSNSNESNANHAMNNNEMISQAKINRRSNTVMGLQTMYKLGHKMFQSKINSVKFGYPHVALQLGNRIIEWTENSLCTPLEADFYFSNAHSVLELPFSTSIKAIRFEDLKKVCEVIANHNATKSFDFNLLNSHQFVDIILNTLGAPSLFPDKVGNVLKDIQKHGSMKNPEFKFKDNTDKSWTFKSHRELDIACREIMRNNPDENDLKLLTIMDRIFWVWWRALHEQEFEQPLSDEEQELKGISTSSSCMCFKWPWTEGSVMELPNPIRMLTRDMITSSSSSNIGKKIFDSKNSVKIPT
eukprot:TRINITY_DN7005_c0_g1_i1.p1 TRINITY_DN7005_c0_g1~~TRINITY_DN7005_c0_g1_i1.p1  ORF type:complete len:574 (-),score=201.41 TRINITY_DN7005_c0_g1_i1:1607-3328(-)